VTLPRPWSPRRALHDVFLAGVDAARARHYLPQHLPTDRPAGITAMIALGKAAGDMAQVALERITVDRGLVVVPRGGLPPGFSPPPQIAVITAAHPLPDGESERAGREALALAQSLGPDDRLLFLVSGGGSALMTVPRDPLTLTDLIEINNAMLRSGAPIRAINTIRRALCDVKGGGLALAANPAEVITLVLSDVPGDELAMVASGPTVLMPSDQNWREDAARYNIPVPAVSDAPPHLPASHVQAPRLVASAAGSLAAMAKLAQEMGFTAINLGVDLEGDAASLAEHHAELAMSYATGSRPVALLSGGETSVALGTKGGRGGRNQTYALALAIALEAHPHIHAFAADSDGIDGNSPFAGAMVFSDTLQRCAKLGLNAERFLADLDSTRLFESLGDGLETGPTFTNVNDLRCILVRPLGN
jgi:glycerate 2-kinase